MRWFWIDRYTEFVRGRRARAVKAVTLAEASGRACDQRLARQVLSGF